MSDLAPVLGIIGMVVTFGWMLRTLLNAWRQHRLIRVQAELQGRLIDKLGSSEDMIRYLEAGSGRQLLEAPPVERTRPYVRILGSLQAGAILAVAGVAMLYVRGQVPEHDAEGFLVLGTLGLALGAGFLISGTLAYFLSRAWGLLEVAGGEQG